MWHDLVGVPGYATGAAGTVTVPSGGCVLLIVAHSSSNGSGFTLFGGASVPIVNGAAPIPFYFYHTLYEASGSGAAAQIVFTLTDHYFVHWVRQGNV
jgi:hypothetical protein